jgi:hypothetical protein
MNNRENYRALFPRRSSLAIGFAGSAIVATNTPTADQCKNRYKPELAKTWTKDQFTKACADMKAPVKK